ncbi:MAG: hypothetical protein U5N53_25895 [Mycobacterium sp.]|nr:hypothetical protein [Mycobacterium sp.]
MVAIATAVLLHRWRRSWWRSSVVIGVAAVALAAGFLVTGDSVPYLFERAAATFGGTVIASVFTVLVVIKVLPRLELRTAGSAAALLCACLAVMFAAVGLMLWRIADDGLQLAEVPIVGSAEEVLAWRHAEPHQRIYGVLLDGRLEREAHGEAREVETIRTLLARIDCGRSWSGLSSLAETWLPSGFVVKLADGSRAWVQGISSVRQAWNWPRGEGRINECALYSDDPVVVWGDPGSMRALGSDEELPAVNAVRVLAYGDAAAFREGFIPAAQRTGRASLALGILNAALALWLSVIGWRTYRRLARDGGGGPSSAQPGS